MWKKKFIFCLPLQITKSLVRTSICCRILATTSGGRYSRKVSWSPALVAILKKELWFITVKSRKSYQTSTKMDFRKYFRYRTLTNSVSQSNYWKLPRPFSFRSYPKLFSGKTTFEFFIIFEYHLKDDIFALLVIFSFLIIFVALSIHLLFACSFASRITSDLLYVIHIWIGIYVEFSTLDLIIWLITENLSLSNMIFKYFTERKFLWYMQRFKLMPNY